MATEANYWNELQALDKTNLEVIKMLNQTENKEDMMKVKKYIVPEIKTIII